MLGIDAGRKPAAPGAPHFALWNMGFRPFYLLASLFASLSVALWVCQYAGYLPFTYLRGPFWPGGEMLFGYATAVVTGFLFTAVRNWTDRPTPSGAALAALALLWVAGRILVVTPHTIAAAWVNAAFPIAAATGIAFPLIRAGSRRNYFLIALLVALDLAGLALHLSYAGVVAWPERASLRVGLDIVLFIMAVMGGRVIPMFTNNGVPGTRARRHPVLERVSLGGLLLLFVADFLRAPLDLLAVLAAALAVAHAARLLLWQPWRTLHAPIVWILHAAYTWIVVHLALRAFASLGLVADAIAVHALTIGGIGGLTIAMMTRTARGHTGRPLMADRFDVACYALVMLAALVRVVGALAWPGDYIASVVVSGACWSVAFALYMLRYWPYLSRMRLDGKVGWGYPASAPPRTDCRPRKRTSNPETTVTSRDLRKARRRVPPVVESILERTGGRSAPVRCCAVEARR